ncbi:LysR family transcriptional regulator [Ornithinimicrobium pekingense]|uniref:LysR family transcriptional regulator n=1 Tax=Ornithinimicrobium pekingense TaxID=384677 RepID=A0ABQ2FC86_9MICO|nr:LysR family transcriptional regulator [Ornithinimicrobium pekingense]GGK80268.1 LysR family transcriptional regulator [Ornithinimicrobium pekingense]
MDTRQLTYFLGVVTHGGFGRAAAQLHVSQPALSQSVASLERDLGVPLFHRVPSGVVLTDAGEVLVPLARQVLRDLDVARVATRSVGEELTGRIDLALMPSQGVEPFTTLMRRLTRRHPGLSVHGHASFVRDDAIALVRSGTCELGLVGALAAPYPSSIEVHTLGRQEMVLIAHPDAGLPDDHALRPAELDGRRLVVSPPGSVMRQMADRLMSASTMTVVVEAEHRSAILPLVLAGVGVAVLSSAWAPLARRSGAAVLRLADTMHLQVDVIHRPGTLTPAAAAFLEIARAEDLPADISVLDDRHS